MPQFFISKRDIIDGSVKITGEDFHHLSKVRRIKIGENILLRCEDGNAFAAVVSDVGKDWIVAKIYSEAISLQKNIPEITLYLAILKSGNFDFAIQKAVEIGVSKIIPLITERTVVPREKADNHKLTRWNKIALEAAKQSLRSSIPQVMSPEFFMDIIKRDLSDYRVICHPGATVDMRDFFKNNLKGSIALLIGPEGGFSHEEIQSALDCGWRALNLGLTHLRAETAAIVIPSIVIYEWS